MNDKQRARLAKAKKELKASGLSTRRTFVSLDCVVCQKNWRIQTGHPEFYTEHVVRTWVGPCCKNSGKEVGSMAQTKEERNAAARARYAQKQAGKDMAIKEKAQPKGKKPRVAETWIKVLSEAVGKKRTDEYLAGQMDLLMPEHKGYQESDVARHRSLYNLGKIKGQVTPPSKKLERWNG